MYTEGLTYSLSEDGYLFDNIRGWMKPLVGGAYWRFNTYSVGGTSPPVKPQRSILQKANSQLQWLIHFRLHKLTSLPKDLHISYDTAKLMNLYDKITNELKESLKADYNKQKEDILVNRKKHID